MWYRSTGLEDDFNINYLCNSLLPQRPNRVQSERYGHMFTHFRQLACSIAGPISQRMHYLLWNTNPLISIYFYSQSWAWSCTQRNRKYGMSKLVTQWNGSTQVSPHDTIMRERGLTIYYNQSNATLNNITLTFPYIFIQTSITQYNELNHCYKLNWPTRHTQLQATYT